MQSVISFVRDNATGSSVGVCVNVYSCMIVLPSLSFSISFDTVALAAYYLAIRIQLIIFGCKVPDQRRALPTGPYQQSPWALHPMELRKYCPPDGSRSGDESTQWMPGISTREGTDPASARHRAHDDTGYCSQHAPSSQHLGFDGMLAMRLVSQGFQRTPLHFL